MFNKMLETIDQPLSQELIKQFHYELKSGVFEDRANGYAIGDYKKRPNIVGMYETVLPSKVPEEMGKLLSWYSSQDVTLEILAEFHVRYESIHPFQDGNGRTGRMILFRECLRHNLSPLIIEDAHRPEYLEALKEYRENGSVAKCVLYSIWNRIIIGTAVSILWRNNFYGGSYEFIRISTGRSPRRWSQCDRLSFRQQPNPRSVL